MTLLSVQNLAISFYGRDGMSKAVDGISYELNRGETLGIVGESGSGKSASCYALLDLIPRPPGKIESGQARFNELDLLNCSRKQMQDVRGNRIAMIFQDPMTSLNPYLRIKTQLLEPLLFHKEMDRRTAISKLITTMEEVGINDAERRLECYPHEFSGGMRQRVMIAMAILTEPDVLIADEPTTALDVTIQAQILELIKSLQQKHDIGVIFITHDLALVSQIAGQVLVMKQGKVVERGPTREIFQRPQHEYTRNLIQAVPSGAKSQDTATDRNMAPILELKHVYSSYQKIKNQPDATHYVVNDIGFNLAHGEILGLVGESGCGKSTLSKTIVRLVKEDRGSIKLGGQELTNLNPDELKNLRKDFQMIFQDPYASLNPRMSIYETLAEPLRLHNLVPKDKIDSRIAELMQEVGLSQRDIRKYPHEFSGGQRQRIAIARALAVEPKLIIADEPVSALDVTIQAQILQLLLRLNQKYQLSMIFISHDLAVIRYIADRTAVMYQGKIVELDETEVVFREPKHSYTRSLLSALPVVASGSGLGTNNY